MKNLTEFAKMRPASGLAQKIIDDLKSPLHYYPFPVSADTVSLRNGVAIHFAFPDPENLLETALDSLRCVLSAKNIPEGKYPIRIQRADGCGKEEFHLCVTDTETVLTASDTEGIRRGIFFLEDRMMSSFASGEWKRKPYIFHRISRCFFGPTNRPPYFIDELMNDVNYYPDEYLNKLAHEGINGVWLTMYFNDFPSSIFPGRGKNAAQRFKKLRETVKRCARYGIRIYVFVCEPKYFADEHFTTPLKDSDAHPEMTGLTLTDNFNDPSSSAERRHCCTSSPETLQFLAESTATLFREVPGLGGMIDLIYGEDNGSCIDKVILSEGVPTKCPRCSRRKAGEIYRDCANAMYEAMHRESPQAEFIGWFYAPRQRDGSIQGKMLAEVAAAWPKESVFMLNLESGVVEIQAGKGRNVFDYSLACCNASELFRNCAGKVAKTGAKVQVGCSHEDASVPFIPVPLNLYRKYRTLHELGVSTVMQCWYFGNYPGLMNRAAGRLSFEPFPQTEDEFLCELAQPQWGIHTPQVVEAWKHFTEGYSLFPANLGFEWYGPLHNSIVWPLHLKPVDQGIAPSWIMEFFPEISGDRIGECLQYQHTLDEAISICDQMSEKWQKGCELLRKIKNDFPENPDRLADIDLAEAVGLQIKSASNVLHFYDLREKMFRSGKNKLSELEKIVRDEISNSEQMLKLCLHDPRLGYHSEAECHLFYPEKLSARIELLKFLLSEDFATFDLHAPWIQEWTGMTPKGPCIHAVRKGSPQHFEKIEGTEIRFALEYDSEKITVLLSGIEGRHVIAEMEPCRLWPPVRADIDEKGVFTFYAWVFRVEPKISLYKKDGFFCFDLPWDLFEGYRHEGFPMRFNLRTLESSYVPGKPWPDRLLQRDYNPNCAAWVILD